MTERYRDEIANASRLLSRAILEKEPDLESRAAEVDALTRLLLREVGREAVLAVLTELRDGLRPGRERRG